MTTIKLNEIVHDENIYPRSRVDKQVVHNYADSMRDGISFPPIVLEDKTNRLLDGWHRVEAANEAEIEELEANWHTVPDDIDVRLYAASLSSKHGLSIPTDDLKQLVRTLYNENESLSIAEVARQLGRSSSTVSDWVRDIAEDRKAAEERHKAARNVAAALLKEIGWEWQHIADLLGAARTTVRGGAAEAGRLDTLDPYALKAALALIPIEAKDAIDELAEKWRQERIFSSWSNEELELRDRLLNGETIVVNLKSHDKFINWAGSEGLYEKIDRRTIWGNPFVLDADGDRTTVISSYEEHYLPYKPSLLERIHTLRGKALGCWCAPLPCHGDVLKRKVDDS